MHSGGGAGPVHSDVCVVGCGYLSLCVNTTHFIALARFPLRSWRMWESRVGVYIVL